LRACLHILLQGNDGQNTLRTASQEWAKVKSNPLALAQWQRQADENNANAANSGQSAAEKKCALLAIKKKICALVSSCVTLKHIKYCEILIKL